MAPSFHNADTRSQKLAHRIDSEDSTSGAASRIESMSGDSSTQTPPNQKLMSLGPTSAVVILLIYLAIMSASLVYSLLLIGSREIENSTNALQFCIGLSLIGAAIFYSRKLYKACISNSYNFESGARIQTIGTFFFFVLRPAFAAVFAWVTHMIWEVTIITSVKDFSEFSITHFYLSGILGFFVGFLAGKVLSRMEAVGEKHLGGVW